MSEEKVKEAILDTGLPTEIMATQMLRDAGWLVSNECPYLDRDKNKIRTLDITASQNFQTSAVIKLGNFRVCELYIECKKSTSQAWVFFTEDNPKSYSDFMLEKYFDEVH